MSASRVVRPTGGFRNGHRLEKVPVDLLLDPSSRHRCGSGASGRRGTRVPPPGWPGSRCRWPWEPPCCDDVLAALVRVPSVPDVSLYKLPVCPAGRPFVFSIPGKQRLHRLSVSSSCRYPCQKTSLSKSAPGFREYLRMNSENIVPDLPVAIPSSMTFRTVPWQNRHDPS